MLTTRHANRFPSRHLLCHLSLLVSTCEARVVCISIGISSPPGGWLRIGGQRNFSFGFYRGLSDQDLVDLVVRRDWSFGKPSGFSSQAGLLFRVCFRRVSPVWPALALLPPLYSDGVTSDETRRAYGHALEMFLGFCDREGSPTLSAELVGSYRVSPVGEKSRPPRWGSTWRQSKLWPGRRSWPG